MSLFGDVARAVSKESSDINKTTLGTPQNSCPKTEKMGNKANRTTRSTTGTMPQGPVRQLPHCLQARGRRTRQSRTKATATACIAYSRLGQGGGGVDLPEIRG